MKFLGKKKKRNSSKFKMLTALIVLLIFSLLIFVHELGHFLVAKKFGMGVEEFGFGLPPRIFGIKRGETIYSINWLPIGGFVRLAGEEGEDSADSKVPKSKLFFSRPKWQRSLVIVAGVVMNFLLAVVVISVVFTQGVMVPSNKIRITEIAQDSPASSAGLKAGDTILAIDGQEIKTSQDLIEYTKKHLGQEIKLEIQRSEDKVLTVAITPRKEYASNQGPMGVVISNFEEKKYPLWQAPILGTKEALRLSGVIVLALGKMIWDWVAVGVTPRDVSGPVGIVQLTDEVIKFGPMAVWQLMGLLSLNLAVVNILPIPALDGGRLLFIAIEAVTRRKVKVHIEKIAYQVGMIALFILIILVTYNDLLRLNFFEKLRHLLP